MKAAKLLKNEFKGFDVVDARDGQVLRRGMKGSDAAAYIEYYDQEVKKAEKEWKK